MVGDDACTTFIELLKRMMDIFSSMEERKRNQAGKKIKPPKIKLGKLSKSNFRKLQKAGFDIKYVTVPAEKSAEVEENLLKMSGSFFKTEVGDSNNAVFAVPASQIDMIQSALKHAVAKDLQENPDKIAVKDGKDLIDTEDIGLVRRVMTDHDIPVVTFKNDDDKYMNFVPKEFEGQYSKALKEAQEIKKLVDGIDVTRYEQTAPLDDLGYEAFVVPQDEAEEIYAAAKADNLEVSFVKQGENVAVMYDSDISEKVEKARQEYKDSLEMSEEYIIDVYDNIITLDMAKLNIEELNTADTYYMRVPNTKGQDYIRIKQSDSELINGGKTLKSELDFDKQYPVYDSSGKVKRAVNGSELAGYFNTRNHRINKDTAVYKYGTQGGELRRIDLFNSKKNELISVKMGSCAEMSAALRERGLNGKTIQKLLEDIHKELNDKQKEIFGFAAEKTEIVYADIPNIGEYLEQSQLSQTVIGKAECIGEIPKDSGSKCCVLDNNTNKFAVIPVMPVSEVRSMLTQMGYSEISAKEIADKVVKSYRETDISGDFEINEEKSQTAKPERYDTNNAELADMGYYRYGSSTVIIKDDAESYRYMQIEKDTPMSEVEKALRQDFGLIDDVSVAFAVKQLVNDGYISDAKTKETEEARVCQVSGNMIEVTSKQDGSSAMMPMDRIDTDILQNMGISEKGANEIKKSFEKNIRDRKTPDKQKLSELKSYAADKIKELSNAVKDKAVSLGRSKGGQEH